ncbi:MBL fold metallo-hydrolase [Bradyrhizobium sp. 183]|uniref:MBL fold metallo-hydrolase n=1 Tax=unclassified Bradyrhizobium TaxID=2631580 RepID=UPI001FFE9D65|nr:MULTISPECIES: MBL fold metallo-hydrolase [unclassified Bradyrhizobium]UPJ79363.1 MBL fold metallo-hydrolase [Bradyrhizobium sp. 184]UPJ87157.1 MBL fold metallo-hydrolase [Bradyrhizobium sp. 183]
MAGSKHGVRSKCSYAAGGQSIAEYIVSRRIGDATITLISEGTFDWPPNYQVPEAEWRVALPEADADGRITLGLHVAHVRLGGASILIDPGCDDPDSEWSAEFFNSYASVTRTPGTAAALAEISVTPEEITHIAISHGHGDHLAGLVVLRGGKCVPRFPNARHYIGRADWENAPQRANPKSDLVRCIGTVAEAGLLELIDRECEIAPGVTLIPTPGETAGHLVVRVDSNDERFFYLGDLFHHAAEIAHLDWISPRRDQPAMIASRRRVVEESVSSGATCIYTHHPFPGWGRIAATGDGYRWVQG